MSEFRRGFDGDFATDQDYEDGFVMSDAERAEAGLLAARMAEQLADAEYDDDIEQGASDALRMSFPLGDPVVEPAGWPEYCAIMQDASGLTASEFAEMGLGPDGAPLDDPFPAGYYGAEEGDEAYAGFEDEFEGAGMEF